ncbi:MAG: 50S ribosomal protein L30 [Candidatus Parvarchaeota archaeon]|nr:50S ribosomal protein L30 [Candidatus Parvarchaeota archaeon]
MEKLCVVRIASIVKKGGNVKDSSNALKLNKLYSCTLLEKNESNLKMLERIDNIVTYGEIDKDTLKALLKKRGMVSAKNKYEWDDNSLEEFCDSFLEGKRSLSDLKINNTFKLHPPIKGFERKGKKTPFSLGGAFGYRGNNINQLLKRMI